ncbi:cytochrome P450 [Crassisporium funariophilum]|nr:cytochrome P450 [Crassisporium funariophilum]
MLDDTLSITLCLAFCSWVALCRYRSETQRLKHIPSVGPDLPLVSYIGTFRFLVDATKIIDVGLKKWPSSMFKVPDLFQWVVVVRNPKHIDELRRAPEDILSLEAAVQEGLQTDYTLGANIRTNPYHLPILRAQLNRNLSRLVPEVHDEVANAFNDFIPPSEDGRSVHISDVIKKIVSRASNRVFVGLPLCRDPEFVDLNVRFTLDVVKVGAILRIVPRILRPLVNSLISTVPTRNRDAMRHLAPIVEARRQREREGNGEDEGQSVNFLSWLMDDAEGEEATLKNLSMRILTINFAAIHTSSMTFLHAFYYLAVYPEYVQPLRDEVEEISKREGWTKEGVDKMHKIDSFIKEGQRLRPMNSFGVTRVAVSDYTFQDGTYLPQGITIGVALQNAHLNPEIYANPLEFDGFRFVKMKANESQNGEKKYEMVSPSNDSLAFGHGRHACPGRFFAACELKLMLAHVVVTYDVELEGGGGRPADVWMGTFCAPNPNAKVLFRKRVL